MSLLHFSSDISMLQRQPQERLETGRGQRSQSSDQNIACGTTVVLQFDSAARGQLKKLIFFWFRVFGNGIRYCPRQRRAPNAVDGTLFETSCLASTQMVLYCWMCEMSVLLVSIATPNASRPMPSWCPSQRNWRSH